MLQLQKQVKQVCDLSKRNVGYSLCIFSSWHDTCSHIACQPLKKTNVYTD